MPKNDISERPEYSWHEAKVRNLTARLDPTPLMAAASQETPGYILKQSSGIFILTNILCHHWANSKESKSLRT